MWRLELFLFIISHTQAYNSFGNSAELSSRVTANHSRFVEKSIIRPKNDTYIEEQFDYLIRDKRDWDEDNASYVNSSGNGTFSEEEFIDSLWELIAPKSWTWILVVFHTLVFVIGIIGNILVCVAVYRNHTMRTVTNYFIVNLAVADFLVILFCLPPSVVWDVTVTWFFGVTMCKIVLYFQVRISD